MNPISNFSRKNLKQADEFVSLTSKAFSAALRFKKALYVTSAAILLIFLGVYWYSNQREKDLEQSSYLFSEAFKVFDAEVVDEGKK